MPSHLLPLTELQIAVRQALRRWRAVALNGPRQSGKSTVAQEDLKLDALYVVYPGETRVTLGDGVEAVPLWALLPNSKASSAP